MDGHHWEVSGVTDFATAFRALPALAPMGASLALAGGACPPNVLAALRRLDVEPSDPISEVLPSVFLHSICIPVSEPTMDAIALLAGNHVSFEIANDVALFAVQTSLLEWFDAPFDPISLAPSFGQSAVDRFAAAVRGTCKKIGRGS